MKQWGMYAEMLQTQVEETGHADGAELEEDEVLFPILSSHPPLPTLRPPTADSFCSCLLPALIIASLTAGKI